MKPRGSLGRRLPYTLVFILIFGNFCIIQHGNFLKIQSRQPRNNYQPSSEINSYRSNQEQTVEVFQEKNLDFTIQSEEKIFQDSDDFLEGSLSNLTITDTNNLSLGKNFSNDWKNITTSGPCARFGHSMVYDSNSNKIVLFGGMSYDRYEGNRYYDDTWIFDLETQTWTEMHSEDGPDSRAYHAMVYESEFDIIVLHGGVNEHMEHECFNDAWTYDLKNNIWRMVNLHGHPDTPTGRCGHSMVFDPFDRMVIVFGGWDPYTETFFDETWHFDVHEDFVECYNDFIYSPSVPEPRAYHSMISDYTFDGDPDDSRIILFGGMDSNGVFGDTWTYETGFWLKVNPFNSPSARFGHSMVFDPFQNQILLFGGLNTKNDTWVYSYPNNNWTQLNPSIHPSGRGLHTMVLAPDTNKTILFGGCSDWSPPPFSWSESPHYDTWIQLGFSYYENGIFTSNKTDLNYFYHIQGNLTWNPTVQPENTSLQFQIGLSNTSIEEDFHFTNLSTANIIFDGTSRYLRYRVVFRSDLIQNSSPLLQWVNISYSLEEPRPTIQITSPQNGSVVTGTVDVSANASSLNGIDKVCFYVDNLLLICLYTAPFNFSWNSELFVNETITLRAVAITVLGNENTDIIQLSNENPAMLIPGVPQNLSASGGESYVILNWDSPEDDGGSPIVQYRVYRGFTSGEYLFYGISMSTSYTDLAVTSETEYFYVVTAINNVGESNISNEVEAHTTGSPEVPLTIPSSPQDLTAIAGDNYVNLTWSLPSDNGGSPITSYRIYRGTISGEYTLIFISKTINYKDTLVSGNTTYFYVVTAKNSIGESFFSNEVVTTPKGISVPRSGQFPNVLIITFFLGTITIFIRRRRLQSY